MLKTGFGLYSYCTTLTGKPLADANVIVRTDSNSQRSNYFNFLQIAILLHAK